MNDQPFVDHAAPILAGDPALSDEKRASLWDAFHSKNSDELLQHLQGAEHDDVPNDTKQALFSAKQQSMPAQEPVDKVVAAMTRLKQMDPAVLEASEAHPNVLKALVGAATASEKGADGGKPSSEPKTSGKQPASGKALVQPPRPDGLEHMPPINPAHFRVLASDGGVHDLPKENIEKARAIDPRLHVLNPD